MERTSTSVGIRAVFWRDHGWIPALETEAGTRLWTGKRVATKPEARKVANAQLELVAAWIREAMPNAEV